MSIKKPSGKVRLRPDQWQAIRERWESDPRPGYLWMVAELSLSVSVDAIKKRASREGWTKTLSLKRIVEAAQKQADSSAMPLKVTPDAGCGFVTGGTSGTSPSGGDGTAVDLRADVIGRHRADWQEFRAAFPLDHMSSSLERARTAKTSAEVLRLVHDGERRAWGLDALVEDTSAGVGADDEALAHFEKAMKQMEQWRQERQGAVLGDVAVKESGDEADG